MIFAINEKQAEKIFESYGEVVAFSLGTKSKGHYDSNGKIVVSYEKSGILPDNDTINGVVAGHIKKKKVIKKAVERLMDPTGAKNGSVDRLVLGMGTLVNLIEDNAEIPEKKTKKGLKKWMKDHPPKVIVFVLPDAESDEDKKRNKFLVEYVSELFKVYGLMVISDKKQVKKTVKYCFNKSKKKNAMIVRDFIINNDKTMQLSKKGRERFMQTRIFYSVEYIQMGLDNSKDPIKMDRENSRLYAGHLASMFTTKIINDNLSSVTKSDKKFNKVVGPDLSKRIRTQAKWYNELNEILKTLGDEFKLPKVKVGTTKKSQKKVKKTGNMDDLKYKMNPKKFIKFFMEKDNRPLLRIVFAHLTSKAAGCEVGTNDYSRAMMDSIMLTLPEEFAKAYVAAAKTYAKNKKAKAEAVPAGK